MVCGEICEQLPVPEGVVEPVEGVDGIAGPVSENGLVAVWLVPAVEVDEFDAASDCSVSQRDDAALRAINMTRTPTNAAERSA
jgi:hypothetical protein